MKLLEVRISNFRNLRNVIVPLSGHPVLIGQNNSGKTAFLEALRLVLPARPPGRGHQFSEYDYFMREESDTPESSPGIQIELLLMEEQSGEWSEEIVLSLESIYQLDPHRDIKSVRIRLSGKYDATTKQFVSKWEVLNLGREPTQTGTPATQAVSRLIEFVRLFYLGALRDADRQLAPGSSMWGRILKDLRLTEDQSKSLEEDLSQLNESILQADPRLAEVLTYLDSMQGLFEPKLAQSATIRALPLRSWELLSKSEIFLKTLDNDVAFPLSRHGQGIQTLAVLFVFRAFVEILMKPSMRPETVGILAIEEPEAHLHPHAVNAVSQSLQTLETQTIVSTHSPYYVQTVPFADIRLFRRDGGEARVLWVEREFEALLPSRAEVNELCDQSPDLYSYDEPTKRFTVRGYLKKEAYRKLAKAFAGDQEVIQALVQLRDASARYLSDKDLVDLDRYAKRSRGEILFARAWLLCEGQSDCQIIRCFSEMLDLPLERSGVSIIGVRNNGAPAAFAGLARTFEIPWMMVCDHDDEYAKFQRELQASRFDQATIDSKLRPLPTKGANLERYLIENGFADDLKLLAEERGFVVAAGQPHADVVEALLIEMRNHKMEYAEALTSKLLSEEVDSSRVPAFFRELIEEIYESVT